jgi:hypothetical protein
VVEVGDPDDVVNRYHARVAASIAPGDYAEAAPEEIPAAEDDPRFGEAVGFFRHGTGEARFTDVQLLDGAGRVAVAVETGKPVSLRARLRCEVDLEGFAVGFFIKDRQGTELFGSNTVEERSPIGRCRAGERVTLEFAFPASFRPGHYSVTVAAAYNHHDMVYLDWVDNALVFQVLPAPGGRNVHGLVDLPLAVKVAQEAPSWT